MSTTTDLALAADVVERVFSQIDGAKLNISTAVVATVDGQVVGMQDISGNFNAVRIAAMTGSLMAVARAVGKEVNFNGCDRLLLDTPSGKIVFRPIQDNLPYLLCVVAPQSTVLGQLIWATDEIAKRLQAAFKD